MCYNLHFFWYLDLFRPPSYLAAVFFRPLLFISHPRLLPELLVRVQTLQLQQPGNFMVIANPLLLGPRLLKVNFNRNKVNKPQPGNNVK